MFHSNDLAHLRVNRQQCLVKMILFARHFIIERVHAFKLLWHCISSTLLILWDYCIISIVSSILIIFPIPDMYLSYFYLSSLFIKYFFCNKTVSIFIFVLPIKMNTYELHVNFYIYFSTSLNDAIQYINPGYGVQAPKIVILQCIFLLFCVVFKFQVIFVILASFLCHIFKVYFIF